MFPHKDACKTEKGSPCKSSFIYNDNVYKGCTSKDSPTGELWCYTKGMSEPKWGYCTGLCPINCNKKE